ncbi:hypothetical protein DNTS_028763, partial [Danionella cerebrum]
VSRAALTYDRRLCALYESRTAGEPWPLHLWSSVIQVHHSRLERMETAASVQNLLRWQKGNERVAERFADLGEEETFM